MAATVAARPERGLRIVTSDDCTVFDAATPRRSATE